MKYTIKNGVAEITIERNGTPYTVLVDAVDLDKVLDMGKWYISKPNGVNGYIKKNLTDKQFEELNQQRIDQGLPPLKVKTLMLHRYLLDLDCQDTYKSPVIDHIDCNGLNNCRSNLRICDRSQNACNKKLLSNSKTGYKGVTYVYVRKYKKKDGTVSTWNAKKPWRAYITPRGQKRINIGHYETAEEAAKAYDQKAKELFGEYAKVNFP
jgi:hypothetical protein